MYFISIIVFLFVLSVSILLSVPLTTFFDLPSLLILTSITIPMLYASGLFPDFKIAFQIMIIKNKDFSKSQLEQSLLAIDLTIKLIVLSGLLGAIIGFVSFLKQLNDPSTIGPTIALILLTTFYALFGVIIFLPVQAKLKKLIIISNRNSKNIIVGDTTYEENTN
jgi:flagellar motor component MotA